MRQNSNLSEAVVLARQTDRCSSSAGDGVTAASDAGLVAVVVVRWCTGLMPGSCEAASVRTPLALPHMALHSLVRQVEQAVSCDATAEACRSFQATEVGGLWAGGLPAVCGPNPGPLHIARRYVGAYHPPQQQQQQ